MPTADLENRDRWAIDTNLVDDVHREIAGE
jgi:hypothetical protein